MTKRHSFLEHLGEAMLGRQLRHLKEAIMARLDPIDAALSELSDQLNQLADQIGALQAGNVTDEEIQARAQSIRDAAAAVDALVEPDAGEGGEPPVDEPPVEPQP